MPIPDLASLPGASRPGGGGGGGGAPVLAQIDNIYSMAFDGLNDNVSIPQINISRTSTISLWFNWTDGIGLNILLGGDAQHYFGLRNNGGFLFFEIDGFPAAPKASIQTDEPFTVDTWYHVVIVQTETPSLSICYINGVDKGNLVNGSQELFIDKIGQWHTFLNQNFNGLIDEVAIFNYALTGAEVLSIYNATAVVDGVNKTGDLSQLTTPPVKWYRMGD